MDGWTDLCSCPLPVEITFFCVCVKAKLQLVAKYFPHCVNKLASQDKRVQEKPTAAGSSSHFSSCCHLSLTSPHSYAESLASTRILKHSEQSSRGSCGENLAWASYDQSGTWLMMCLCLTYTSNMLFIEELKGLLGSVWVGLVAPELHWLSLHSSARTEREQLGSVSSCSSFIMWELRLCESPPKHVSPGRCVLLNISHNALLGASESFSLTIFWKD